MLCGANSCKLGNTCMELPMIVVHLCISHKFSVCSAVSSGFLVCLGVPLSDWFTCVLSGVNCWNSQKGLGT